MQKWYFKKGYIISFISLIVFSVLLLLVTGVGNSKGKKSVDKTDTKNIQLTVSEDYPAYVKYLSFQNSDSTWGFTILLNSRPYLHHKKIPVNKSESGFQSKNDAEIVAGLFVKMIEKGNLNPELNKDALDSLGIVMN